MSARIAKKAKLNGKEQEPKNEESAPPYRITDDDLRSGQSDWVTRPIAAHLLDNVYQANRTGALAAIKEWPEGGQVLNLCVEPIDHPQVNNDLTIEDTRELSKKEADYFIRQASDCIEKLHKSEAPWVVVNCQAGVNRSSAAILGWLLRHRQWKSLTKAKKLVETQKRAEAKRLRFKNRYQSYEKGSKTEHDFSWPTLAGRSAPILTKALLRVMARENQSIKEID